MPVACASLRALPRLNRTSVECTSRLVQQTLGADRKAGHLCARSHGPVRVLLLYRTVLYWRQTVYDATVRSSFEQKQGRIPDPPIKNRNSHSILCQQMRGKRPYFYMTIHFHGIRTHPGYDQASGSRGQIEDANRGWKMPILIRGTRDPSSPLAGEDISHRL
jgi:hypothetical protein